MAGELRAAAARVVARVLDGASASAVLPTALAACAPAERALFNELVLGTLRFAPRHERVLSQLMDKPLGKRGIQAHAALLVGVHQLLELSIPEHAAVAETVEAQKRLGATWATGLTNAVLRRLARERDHISAALADDPEHRYAHPRWYIDAVMRDWPDDFEAILTAGNARAPLTLRVNRRHTTREAYLATLAAAGIAAQPHASAPDAVVLEAGLDPRTLPGFADGSCSVQDAAAQLAVELMDLEPGLRVLDACAAPGGKTAHILEREPGLAALVALDADASRLDRVAENLLRLGLSASLKAGDAGAPEAWWDGKPFDRILLDAPCSATGVIRRHPDIKLLRRPTDIDALAATQSRLLDALWPLLAPGGRLVYATCSVLEREGARQVARFLLRTPDAVALPVAVPWGRPRGVGRQILPGEAAMDGFFYASLVRRSA
jgi:16S rRNA (cytosine967-C5)-methyltransferase